MLQRETAQLSFDLLVASIAPPKSRKTDPVTSYLAAKAAKDLAKQHAILILGALRRGPRGVDGIAHITGLSSYQISKRMSELARTEPPAIKETGRTVKSDAGRQQREWELA